MTLGCDVQLSKDYAYQRVEREYPWGKLSVILLGKDSNVDGSHPVRGAPYDLHVLVTVNSDFLNPTKNNCHVAMDSLELTNPEAQRVVFAASKLEANFEAGYKTNWVARFPFDGLDLSYIDYSMRIEVSVLGNCGSDKKILEVIPIHRDYKEEKITFWDKLMGI